MKEPEHNSCFFTGHTNGRSIANHTPSPTQRTITYGMQMKQLQVWLLITTGSNLDGKGWEQEVRDFCGYLLVGKKPGKIISQDGWHDFLTHILN